MKYQKLHLNKSEELDKYETSVKTYEEMEAFIYGSLKEEIVDIMNVKWK